MDGLTDDALIPLAELAQELNRQYGSHLSYNALWNLTITDQLPVTRKGRRLYAKRSDKARVAQLFGLTPRQPAPGP